MKIPQRFSISNLICCLSFLLILFSVGPLRGQTISGTNTVPNCSDCAPTNWSVSSGSPDVSSPTIAATAAAQGGNSNWVVSPSNLTPITLPSPPNTHNNWLSLRDTGSATQEGVSTTISGLTAGRTYEVIVYSLTAVTNVGQASRKYAGTYNESFNFQIIGFGSQSVAGPLSINTWNASRVRFTANANSHTLIIRGGLDSAAGGSNSQSDFLLYETVQLSVTNNGINTMPVADDNSTSTVGGTPIVFNVVSTDVDYDGTINVASVDLDPSSSGIQTSATTSEGTWSVDNLGNVTFTADPNFFGTATINYTVNDNFSLDGTSRPGTSNAALLSVNVLADPSIEVTKTASVTDNGDGITGRGDTIVYTISVENTGNTVLNNVNLVDTLEDANGNGLTLTSGPIFTGATAGSGATSLTPGGVTTFTATYLITQAAVDSGGVINSVFVDADSSSGGTVSDVSDDGDDSDGNTTDDDTEIIIPANPQLDTIKTFSTSDNGDGVLGVNDVITYTIRIRNTGNVTITGVNLIDTLEDFLGNARSLTTGPIFVNASAGSSSTTIIPGGNITYTASYAIVQADVVAGGLRNSVLVEGTDPSGAPVSDVSDDNDDTDGNSVDDPTETPLPSSAALEVTKTASLIDNGDGVTGVNDVITYTISVENTGNVDLTGVAITSDTLEDLLGNPLTLTTPITFVEADRGSPEGTLVVGEIAEYTVTYSLTQSDVNAGGVQNSATASGTFASTTVTDVSDDGDDSDGNTSDDPTITTIVRNPNIEAVKTFAVSDNGDGVLGVDDIISYTIAVRNTGNVDLTNINLTDTLLNGFGNPLNLTTGPTFVSSSLGSTEGNLKVGERATYTATYVLTSSTVDSGSVSNSVEVSAESIVGTPVNDVSDDGDDSDGNTLDDPTVTPIPEVVGLEVTKTASLADNGDGVTGINDVISYSITIENTGNVTLTNIDIVDTLEDLLGNSLSLTTGPTHAGGDMGSPAGTIRAGETKTYTATYVLTQSDVNAGGVRNSATVDGEGPSGTPASDVSDDGIDSDGNTTDDPTETLVGRDPAIEATKIAALSDNGDNVLGVGDVISYTILIKNTGNVDLVNVDFTDTLTNFNGSPRSLTTGPSFVSNDLGSPEGELRVGETSTYTATYIIAQSDVNSGGVRNFVEASGESILGVNVTDISDDGDDTDGNTEDDPTETVTPELPGLEATKVATVVDDGDGMIGVDDLVNYTITVRNTGNVNLSNVDITDTLTDLAGNGLTLTTGPTFVAASQGSSEGVLLVGEIATYTAVYVITQSDVDAGGISNTVEAEGQSPFGIIITDTSDDGNDSDGNTVDDPTVTLIPEDPSVEATKIASIVDNGDGSLGAGDTVNYTITIENTGTVSINGISLVDTLTNLDGTNLALTSGPTFVSASLGSSEGTLLPDEIATYTASYVLTTDDVNAGGIRNSVDVSADSPQGTNVTDTSDDGDDTDGNTTDDPTETLIPRMEITKTYTVTDEGDGILGPGDTINYTIVVENTGALPLTGLSLVDTLTDLLGNPRTLTSGPTFANSSAGSPEGSLQPGETATYTATYILVVDDVVALGVSNSVEGSAQGPEGNNTTDTSDDGDDTDGNTEDDPTITPIVEVLSLETTKTVTVTDEGDGVLGVGDTLTYTITVENTGNVTLTNVNLTDTLSDFLGNTLTLTTGPTFVATNLLGIEGILIPGEIATYTATYIITQSDVDAAGVSNTVDASGESPLGNNVTDTSDDGDDTDGNTEDDPTETPIPEVIGLQATKTFAVTDDGDGVLGVDDLITYTITVQNTGNVTVNNINLVDTLLDFESNGLTLTTGPTFVSADSGSGEGSLLPGETATYTATYLITQSDVDAGGVSNSVEVSGESPSGTNVTDTSDDGDDTDGNTEDDPTETPIVQNPSLEATKTASITDDGDGVLGAGDLITYTITVENTGTVTLSNVDLVDNLSDFLGNSLSLDSGPTFVSADLGSLEGTLLVGETATYTAVYTITQSDVDAGGVRNSAVASADAPDGTNVTDTSDDGDDTDGNTTDDPTETPISQTLGLETTKTFTVTDDGDGILGAGDTIEYTITVQNTGTVTLTGVDITDNLSNFAGAGLSLTTGPTFVSADSGSPEGTLQVDEIATYTATYVITQADVDAGGVSNSAIASGDSPGGTNVTDTSDDGDDTDGNTEDDPTETPISETVSLEATKTYTITNNGSEVLGVGDVINYTITVENTGNVTVTGITLVDSLSDFLSNPLTLTTGPIFESADLGSPEGTLIPGEIATYSATYIITQSDVDAGGVSNTVDVSGSSPDGTNVTETSDDGDDTDGNTEDDPTETPIPLVQSIETTKVAEVSDNGDGFVGVGDVVTYTITVENTGNTDLFNVELTDTFTDLEGNPLTLDSGPDFVEASLGSPEGTLLSGEVATYTATYTITQSDVDAGGVSNSVFTTSDDGDGTNVTDTSDDGDDDDGNSDDDPTETLTDSIFALSITKDVDEDEPMIGDNVTFTITISNDGLVTASNIVVSDLLPSGYDFVSYTATAGTYTESTGDWVIDILNPGDIQILEILVEVLPIGDYLNTATIADTDRGTDDNPSDDTDTATVEPLCLIIYNEFSPNGDGANETFVIDCIERYPNSKLEIYNRWGSLVYEDVGYQNDWTGTSNGDAVIDQDSDLPVGTYYYVLDLKNGSEPRSGWLYINR